MFVLTVKDIVLRMHTNHFHALCNLLCTFWFSLHGISKILCICLPACLVFVHCTFHSAIMNVQCCYSNCELSQMTVSWFLLQLTCDWNECKKKKMKFWLREEQDLGMSVTVFCGVKGYYLCQGIAWYHYTSWSNPITGLDRPWGFQVVDASRFPDIQHM